MRHVATHDALGETFRDRRFADARLADENGVVFRFARQNADHIADFLVAADHRVELFAACALNEVITVFFQRIVGVLRRIRRYARRAAHAHQDFQKRILCDMIVAK